ncbi:MAG: molybdopterin molybdotransferase MoeA [Oceanococcus sp.]
MITLDHALSYYRQLHALKTVESVPLSQALGRSLAQKLRSRLDLPPMRQSAMDGYAVHSRDLASASTDAPVTLPIHQEAAAGSASRPLPPGHCARIFTGAPVPPGADTIEIQENVLRQGENVVFQQAINESQHIREQGEELRSGHVVLNAGKRLDAQSLSIAANAGHGAVACRRKTRVAVIVTGNELTEPGQARDEAQVFDCNGTFLRHFISEMDADLSLITRCRDDREQLANTMNIALTNCDVLFVTGGASVGDHDHSRVAAQDCGVQEIFWKVAQKPGKPISYGLSTEGKQVMILPGNPASVYVAAMVHARHLLHALQARALPQCVEVISEHEIHGDLRRERLLRASLRVKRGQLLATTLSHQASHMNSNLAQTQAILRVPAGQHIAPNQTVRAWIKQSDC